MKRIAALFLSVTLALTAVAQDIIIFSNGDEVQAKVTEVSDETVKYKVWSNLDGPSWTKKTSEIFMIRYENGTKQTFSTTRQQPVQQPVQQSIQQQSAYLPQQPSTVKMKTPSAFDFGVYVRGGYNWMTMKLTEGSSIEKYVMGRGAFSFGGYVDYAWGQEVTSSPFYNDAQKAKAAINPIGISLGVCYATRGGANKSVDIDFDLTYLAIRPALAMRFRRLDGRNDGVMHVGLELGVLQNAIFTSTSRGADGLDYYDRFYTYSFGSFIDCMFHVSRHITIGGYLEFALPLLKDHNGVQISSENIAVGIMFGFGSAGKRLSRAE